MPFENAVRERRKLRMSIHGPSKSGKTYTSLLIATALAESGKVALIDTENKTSEIYADRFKFDVQHLADHHPDNYVAALTEAVSDGYEVAIIDSMTHAWAGKRGILELVDSWTPSGGSAFTSGWNAARPVESSFWQAILGAPIHLIITMRVKTAYVMEEETRGSRTVSVPKKVGLAPIQREGVEYEFDIVASMDLHHTLTIEGTRYEEVLPEGSQTPKPGAEFAVGIKTLMEKGVEPKALEEAPPEEVESLRALLLAEGREEKAVRDVMESTKVKNRGVLPPEWVTRESAAASKRLQAAGLALPGEEPPIPEPETEPAESETSGG